MNKSLGRCSNHSADSKLGAQEHSQPEHGSATTQVKHATAPRPARSALLRMVPMPKSSARVTCPLKRATTAAAIHMSSLNAHRLDKQPGQVVGTLRIQAGISMENVPRSVNNQRLLAGWHYCSVTASCA